MLDQISVSRLVPISEHTVTDSMLETGQRGSAGAGHSVLRYSSNAFLSRSLKLVPYSCPHGLFPELILLQSVTDRVSLSGFLGRSKTNVFNVIFPSNAELRFAHPLMA